jgi:tRNA threonylcarbamoyladenosine modification (KEOPS) complex Cgi121 subunit
MEYTILQAEVTVSDETDFLDEIRKISAENNVYITFFDADYIADIKHIESALFHGLRAFCSGENISRTPDMEVLLYAAGTRQCSCAVQIGLKKGLKNYYVLIFSFPDEQKISGEQKSRIDIPDFFVLDDKVTILKYFWDDSCKSDVFKGKYTEILTSLNNISCSFPVIGDLRKKDQDDEKSDLSAENIPKNAESSEGKYVRSFFEISEDEIQASPEKKITDFVLERVALLEISK